MAQPLPPMPDQFDHAGWHFEAINKPMLGTDRLGDLAKNLGMWSAPDMFFGDSALRFVHSGTSTVLTLCPADALSCCSWRSPAPSPQLQPDAAAEASGEPNEPMFGTVQCQYAKKWKPAENPDVKEIEVTSDWTYSTGYWGTLQHCVDGGERVFLRDFDADAEESVDEGLPMDLLRQRDAILWYNEVTFWEHELDDCGLSRIIGRVRVMPTFWFALLSFELRVDGVLIRDVSTRFFCKFGEPTPPSILREWTWREATYEQLRARGVDFDNTPHVSQESIGSSLLNENDVKRRLRHKIRLGGPS